jgi:hypothetical protein
VAVRRRCWVPSAWCGLISLVFVATMATPSYASATSSTGLSTGSIGVRLLVSPVGTVNSAKLNSAKSVRNARSLRYIVADVAPGTVIHRRIEVSNTTGADTRVSLYPAAANVVNRVFLGAPGHTVNELSAWTSVTPNAVTIPAGGQVTARVTIVVPEGAAPGERYSAVWAQVRSAAGLSHITQIDRVGIRTYLSIGPGAAPAGNFTVDSLTTAAHGGGHVIAASVHNVGGRVLHVSGTLRLRSAQGEMNAGPYPVTVDAAVAVGATSRVTLKIPDQLPLGSWYAALTLHSGNLQRTARAVVTFPSRINPPRASATTPVWQEHLGLEVIAAAAIGLATLLAMRRRRRLRAGRTFGRTPGHLRQPAEGATTATAGARRWARARGRHRRPPRSAAAGVTVLVAGLLLPCQLFGASAAFAATTPVALGSAAAYSVLSATSATSSGTTVLSADLGVSPSGTIVGFPSGTVEGTENINNAASAQALADFHLAYNDAAGRATQNAPLPGDLNGMDLAPGVYATSPATALALTGTLTLDGQNTPGAVWVFQIDGAFNPAAAATVNLINGAEASNVFWQVNGAVGLGASASIAGTIMAAGAITLGAGATLTGAALADGAITLSSNNVTTPPTVTITGGASVFTPNTTPTIAGTADAAAGTTVTVTVAGQTLTSTLATAGGAWSVTAATVPAGTYQVVASVTGPAGNVGRAQQTLTVGATTPVALGSAAAYSVLSATSATSSGTTVLSADLGVSPSGTIVGFPSGTVEGTENINNAASAQALADFHLAYNDAAGRATQNAPLPGDLNGMDLAPGVYATSPATALALTGTLTLDGQNTPGAVWVFQIDGAFNPAAAATVNLINGAEASNVFWQVNGAVGLGASASIAGTIMAAGAITLGAGATLTGAALADGAITLSSNNVTGGSSGGALSITVPTSPVDLGTYTIPTAGQEMSGSLGTVQVSDTRSGTSDEGWVASVVASNFTSPSGPGVAASSISYSAGPIITARSDATYTDDHPSNLSSAVPAVTATGATGYNATVTTWDPTISFAVPGGLTAGVYSSTVTQSVL